MNVKKWRSFWFFLSLMIFSVNVFAASSPVDLLQNTADKIITKLQQNKANLRNNAKISYNIVNQYLVPMVDQNAMAQAVLGRTVWNSATSNQKQAFIEQFRILVVRTYAAAIAQFTNETIKFMPVLGDLSQPIITVKSQIIRNNAPNVPVSYTLVASNHAWKVIDFSVDGISMVQSFKSQFQDQLSTGGIENLITALKAHNQKNG